MTDRTPEPATPDPATPAAAPDPAGGTDTAHRLVAADLAPLLGRPGHGVHWTLAPDSDLNVNLVRLDPGGVIEGHVNATRDIVLVVLDGDGTLTVDGRPVTLAAPMLVHIPKGTERRLAAGPAGLNHLTVHVRNPPLTVGPRR